jgi:GntR family transcriptional regulator/MocR family aminotransferase
MSSPVFPYGTSIAVDKNIPSPVYVQIANGLVALIRNGQLKTDTRLPGTREMAAIISLHRNTVIAAYNELISQGWAIAKPSQGTFVINKLPINRPVDIGKSGPTDGKKASIWFNRREHLDNYDTGYQNYLTIDEGVPDVRLAPIDLINRAYKNVVKHSYQNRHLSYTDPRGDTDLRNQLQSYLQATRGINVSTAQILITRGSQMGIYLASQTLIQQGDQVVVGDTNYLNTNLTFQDAGASLISCPVDHAGLNTEALEKICQSHSIKVVYVTPHHHHPTTATLTAERRLHLLRLAENYDFVIIEDDYDYDYHYERAPIMPLASADVQGRVIYLGGISKLVAPVYRIGYMIGPSEYLDATARFRKIIDRQGDTILERAFAHLFQMGDIQRHAKKALQIYRHRWQAFGDSLESLPKGILHFKRPAGGMAYWVGLDKAYHWDTVSEMLLQHKVVIPDYAKYDHHELGHNHIRLGFASLNDEERNSFIDTLHKVLKLL